MKFRGAFAILNILISGLLFSLRAQEEPLVVPGTRVRITATKYFEKALIRSRVVGTVVALTTDSLVVQTKEWYRSLAIPITSVTALDVSRGLKSKIVTGAGIGFLIGGAAALMVFSYAGDSDAVCPDECISLLEFSIIPLAPTLLGALIGALVEVDRWETVALPSVQIGFAPGPGPQLQVGLSISL